MVLNSRRKENFTVKISFRSIYEILINCQSMIFHLTLNLTFRASITYFIDTDVLQMRDTNLRLR